MWPPRTTCNRSGTTAHDLAMERYWISRRRYYRKWYGWLGGLLYGATRLLLETKWAKRRTARPPFEVIDLGSSSDRPVIALPRPYQRFLVEIALDPRFYLAGAVLASGDRWTPEDRMLETFGPMTYFFRVVDLTLPDLPQIGVYRHQLLAGADTEAPAVPVPATPGGIEERG